MSEEDRAFYGNHIVKKANGKYLAWVRIQDDCLPCGEKDSVEESRKDWLQACQFLNGQRSATKSDAKKLKVYKLHTELKAVSEWVIE